MPSHRTGRRGVTGRCRSDSRPIAISDTTQDIRFAVAMSGGVSLAVWMGGVAREVNLLQQASNVRQHESAAGPGAPGPDPARPARVRSRPARLGKLLRPGTVPLLRTGTAVAGSCT